MSARLCPGGTVVPTLEPLDRLLVQEELTHLPRSSPLQDYLRNRLAAEKVPTADLAAVRR